MYTLTEVKAGLVGLAVGDALGVPVEFRSRSQLLAHPVAEMLGYGTHHQPAGTWSDDTSMTLCTVEALCEGYDLQRIASLFLRWLYEGYWTANGQVFDVGNGTRAALQRIRNGMACTMAGGTDEHDNGNGALMRILPLAFFHHGLDIGARYACVKEVAGITHGHIRSTIACFYYVEFLRNLKFTKNMHHAYDTTSSLVQGFLQDTAISAHELNQYERLFQKKIWEEPLQNIYSSGYVVHSIEAAIWCLFTTSSYAECVLQAVNLGEDTDTTAAIVGGLAGWWYGLESIPIQWQHTIARHQDILGLAERLHGAMSV